MTEKSNKSKIYALINKEYHEIGIKAAVVTKLPPYAFILGKDGIFLRVETDLYTSYHKGNNIFEKIEEEVTHSIPQIPYEIYSMVLGFFREVYSVHKSEAVVLLALSPEHEYKVIVPPQVCSGGSAKSTLKADLVPLDHVLVGSIHSHPSFGASQSSIDLHDEEDFDGIHITIGHVENEHPDIHQRLMIRGDSFTVKDMIATGPIIAHPSNWIDQVSTAQIGYQHSAWNVQTYNFVNNNQHKPIWDEVLCD